MSVVLSIIQVILICMFAFSATIKFLRKPMMVNHWNEYRYPMWFMFVIATLELTGVIGLVAAFWFQRMLLFATVLFVILMIGAIHAHFFRAKHSPLLAINAVIMLLLSIILIIA